MCVASLDALPRWKSHTHSELNTRILHAQFACHSSSLRCDSIFTICNLVAVQCEWKIRMRSDVVNGRKREKRACEKDEFVCFFDPGVWVTKIAHIIYVSLACCLYLLSFFFHVTHSSNSPMYYSRMRDQLSAFSLYVFCVWLFRIVCRLHLDSYLHICSVHSSLSIEPYTHTHCVWWCCMCMYMNQSIEYNHYSL